jgi:cell division protein FtsB
MATSTTEMVSVTSATAATADVETGGAAGGIASAGNPLPPEPIIGQGFLKPIPETTPLERVAAGVALGAVVTAVVAVVVEQSLLVIIGGVLSSIVGPYCYYQQTRLTDIRTLQETKKAITAEVDRLETENKRLVKNIDDMTTSVDRLQEIDQALAVITESQGQSMDAFAKQVADNKEILQQMKGNLKANVLQNLLSVILRSDSDQDFTMDQAEVDTLMRRLQNISGVTVKEEKFRAAIQGQSINAVMEIVKNLLRPNVPESERIFELQQQEELSVGAS